MKNPFERLGMYFERKRYGVILNNRRHLTDFEADQLIPDLKNRLAILKKYFQEIINICAIQEESKVFTDAATKIINGLQFQADEHSPQGPIAKQYFNDIKNHSKEQGVGWIDQILNDNKEIITVKQLIQFANEVNFFCSAMATIKNDLLLYKINTYPYITKIKTGETIAAHPQEYYLTIEPFQNYIYNIIEVSKATIDSIQEWNKSTQRLKNQYLELYNTRLSLRNTRAILLINILAIILAVSVSAFFLTANDPFNLYKSNENLKKENYLLKEQIKKILKDNISPINHPKYKEPGVKDSKPL